MRVSVTVVDPRHDSRRDVLIDAADETPMAEVLAGLQREALGVVTVPGVPSLAARRAADAGESPLYLDGRVLDTGGTLADSGLREGSLVVVGDAAASSREEPSGTVELRLVSGRGAGAVHRLDVGEATIGGDPACVVCLPDDRIPPVAVTVSVAADGTVTLAPYDDAVETLTAAFPNHDHALALDREALTEDTTWPVGGLLQLGDFLVELEQVGEPDAAVAESPDPGWLDYNRPPRLLPPLRQTTFKLPSPPSEQTRIGLPWLVMLMPLALAIVFVLVTGRLYMLMMGLFSPVMMLGNYFQNRKQGKMSYRQQMADYKDKKRRIEEDAEQAVVDERLARRLDAPDPAMVLLVANGPRVAAVGAPHHRPRLPHRAAGGRRPRVRGHGRGPRAARAPAQDHPHRLRRPRRPSRCPSGAWSASPGGATSHAASAPGPSPSSRSSRARATPWSTS